MFQQPVMTRQQLEENALRTGQIPPPIDLKLLLPQLPPALVSFQRVLYGLACLTLIPAGFILWSALNNGEGISKVVLFPAALFLVAFLLPKIPRHPFVRYLLIGISLLPFLTFILIPLGIWMIRYLTRDETKIWFGAADEAYKALV